MQIQKNHIHYALIIVVVLLGLKLVWPLFQPGIPLNVDLPCHYTRLWCIQEASSIVPNNWCPHQAGGMPSSQTYYPPLDFLIAMLGYVFGLEWTFKVFVALSLFLPGLGAYWLLKKRGYPWAGLFAFALLTLFPGSWQAGGFEETVMVGFWHYMSTIGFLFLALTYYLEFLEKGQKKNLIWTAIFTIFITHPFTLLYAALLFATVTLYYHSQALKQWKGILLFAILAVLLNAYYWLPLFAKLSYFPSTGNVAMTWHNLNVYLFQRIPWYAWGMFLLGLILTLKRKKPELKPVLLLSGITLLYALKELWIPPFLSGDRVMAFLTPWILIYAALFLHELLSTRIAAKPKNIPLWPVTVILLLVTAYGFYADAHSMSKNIFTSSHPAFQPQMKAFELLKNQPLGRVVMEETLYNYGNNPQSLTHTECALSPLTNGKEGVNFALAYFPRKTNVIHHDNAGNFFNKPIQGYTHEEIRQKLNEFNILYVIAHTQNYADALANHSVGYQVFEPNAVFKTNIQPSYFKTRAKINSEEYHGTHAKAYVEANETTPVVLKVNAYPNWKTYVDGKPSKTEECDYFVCTTVNPGPHLVEFRYEAIGVDYMGYFLSLIGLAGLVWYWKRNRHEKTPETKKEIQRKYERPEKRVGAKTTSTLSWKKELLYILILALILTGIYLYPALKNLDYYGIRDWGAMILYPLVSRITLLQFHQIPLWNPYPCGGNLLLAHPHTPLFSPFFLFTLLFNVYPGIKISFYFYYVLGFLGSYSLAKKYGMEWRAALFTALTWTYTSTLAGYFTEGYAHWGAQMLIPWAFYFYVKSTEKAAYAVATALVLAWIIHSGYYWGFVLMSTVLSVYALLETLRHRKARYVTLLALAFAIAFLLCAIKLIPLLEYSHQYPKIDTEERSAYTWKALYTALLDPKQGPYDHEGPGGEWFNFSLYYGWLPLLLSLLGLLLYAKKYWTLLITGLVALWISFGHHAWINLYALLKKIPAVTTSFHSPARFNIVFLLILALYAGLALHRFLATKIWKIGDRLYTFTPGMVYRKKKNQHWIPEHARTILVVLLCLYLFFIQVHVSKPYLAVAFPAPAVQVQPTEFIQFEAPNWPNPYTGSTDLFVLSEQGQGLLSAQQALLLRGQGKIALPIYDSLYGNKEYLYVQSNVGTTNCYSTFHLPGQVQPKYYWNGTENTKYRGETYVLNGKGEAHFTKWSPNEFIVEGSAAENDVLVLNQNYYKGWKADQGEVVNTNGLISTPVQAGNFKVRIYFNPTSFWIGTVLSTLTALVLILWVIFYRHKPLFEYLPKKWGEHY